MRRKIAVVGDTLTSGGRLLPYVQSVGFRFHGHMAALIGGAAYCDACASVGTTAKAGGPRRMHYLSTRDVALDGDAVLCKCQPSPRIVAALSLESWYEDMAEHDAGATTGPDLLQPAPCRYGERFTLVNRSNKPLAGVRYRITSDSGDVFTGTTDMHGQTERYLSGTAVSLKLERLGS